jgi:hypothetical protein
MSGGDGRNQAVTGGGSSSAYRLVPRVTAFYRLLTLGILLAVPGALEAQLQGRLGVEARAFPMNPLHEGADHMNGSVSIEPEWYKDFDRRRQRILVHAFLRVDGNDDARTHFDLRELMWERVDRWWEVRIGLGLVYWGVTESQHLVDIINQTDLVENPDGEDKLGQPMINFTLVQRWGTIDVFVLPFFRERTFPGSDGRLRPPLVVDRDNAQYESSAGRSHTDFALRWSHILGEWDVGVSAFRGTNRDPLLVPTQSTEGPVLTPYYQQINQIGLDLQRTFGGWLWKLEAITRGGETLTRYLAFTGGFEYTFVGALGSDMDIGVLTEYLYDSRGRTGSPFQNDIFLGSRIAFNDVQSTAILVGGIIDHRTGETLFSVEANRRLDANWLISIEARAFIADQGDTFAGLRRDGYLQVELNRFF